jgi:hypothetical protein
MPEGQIIEHPSTPAPATSAVHSRPKAIVAGALANKPLNGGNAWTRLSWVRGLRDLGFDVMFVEQIDSRVCVDEKGEPTAFVDSTNADYFRKVAAQFDLTETSALLLDDGREVIGCSLPVLREWAEQSQLLVNIGGHLSLGEIRDQVQHRVYFDDDPGYTQFWQIMGSDHSHLEKHDCFYTLGVNIGQSDCAIPAQNVPWRPINPPVVLSDWPVRSSEQLDRFTTIASWRGSYGPIYYGGVRYGLKAHEFRKFISLPSRCEQNFEIALQIHEADRADRDALVAAGWSVREAQELTRFPSDFRDYVQTSGAEFSVAQGIYVQTNSGWFSDRTIRYLASGRPVLVQDTGFGRHLPVGSGLCSFTTLEEAATNAESIARDYQEHCREARRIAEQYFDANVVIGGVLRDLGIHRQ